jgi:hypothetical protein
MFYYITNNCYFCFARSLLKNNFPSKQLSECLSHLYEVKTEFHTTNCKGVTKVKQWAHARLANFTRRLCQMTWHDQRQKKEICGVVAGRDRPSTPLLHSARVSTLSTMLLQPTAMLWYLKILIRWGADSVLIGVSGFRGPDDVWDCAYDAQERSLPHLWLQVRTLYQSSVNASSAMGRRKWSFQDEFLLLLLAINM